MAGSVSKLTEEIRDRFERLSLILGRSQHVQIQNDVEALRKSVMSSFGMTGDGLVLLNRAQTKLHNLTNDDRKLVRRQELQIKELVHSTHDGEFTWRIPNVAREAKDETELYSVPFYTSPTGYKMCACIYMNGAGLGAGSHVSVFVALLKHDYDRLQEWPFHMQVTISLMSQDQTSRRHLTQRFIPETVERFPAAYNMPTTDMNKMVGFPLFVNKAILEDPTYVRDDTIFVKVCVEKVY